MMFWTAEEEGPRIVRTEPGAMTGETIYVDERGGRWTTETRDCGGATVCPTRARVVGGRIVRQPERLD